MHGRRFVQLCIVQSLHRFVSDSVSLRVHIIVEDGQVKSLSHFDLHSAVMQSSIGFVWCKAGGEYGVVKGAIDSDYTTWLVNGFDYGAEERASIAIILLKAIAQNVLRYFLPVINCLAHLFLI